MGEKQENIVEDGKINKENAQRKEEFEAILAKIKKMSEALELHTNVKDAVSKKEIDNNYLKYIENSLEDKLFCDAKFDTIRSKVLLEVICPNLTEIENFDIEKLEISDIGSHKEENENYIDKICTYNNKFICLFGVNEDNLEKVIKYEARKFSRLDMIEAICEKIEEGKSVEMQQYDEYYVVSTEDGIKVFSERKVTALINIEETVFDKMKNKLISIFNKNKFVKRKYLPNVELIYDSNPNRFKDFKLSSKLEAKSRMKALLIKEREVTRNTNN